MFQITHRTAGDGVDELLTDEVQADPLRLYLRQVGEVSLLTREGEVEIAKRLAEGNRQVTEAVLGSQFAVTEMLRLCDALKKGAIRVKEVACDLDPEVDEALRTVRQLALRTNMGQPFTGMLL